MSLKISTIPNHQNCIIFFLNISIIIYCIDVVGGVDTPQRTFLEKIFLLHEDFSQDVEKIRIDRLSRHLYDLEKLMDTEHGIEALKNTDLYNNIVAHREKFNPLRGLDYANHIPSKISILPPDGVMKDYERDYDAMTSFMIYGEPLKFYHLMKRILELQMRINGITK